VRLAPLRRPDIALAHMEELVDPPVACLSARLEIAPEEACSNNNVGCDPVHIRIADLVIGNSRRAGSGTGPALRAQGGMP
jgi:hypothetical protein